MFCGHCDRQIPDTSKSCAYCGHPAKNAQAQGYAPQYQQPHRHAPCGYSSPPPLMAGVDRTVGHTARNTGRYRLCAILSGITVSALFLTVLLYALFLRLGKPEDTVANLEKALNALDTDAMLDCFDEQTQKLYSGSLGMAGPLLGMNLRAISDLASCLDGIMAGAGLTPRSAMRVTDSDYFDKDTCLVTIIMSVSYEGDTESETMQLPMKKSAARV